MKDEQKNNNQEEDKAEDKEVLEDEVASRLDEEKASEEAEENIKALKDELYTLLKEKDEMKSLLQRVQADFDNFRKRTTAEKNEIYNYALFDFICKILPVLDNMERAMDAAEKEKVPRAYLEGLEMIRKQIDQLLEQQGVAPIDTKGCVFDPNYHDAVMQTEEGEGEPNTVTEELQKGYVMKDRVLRPAMVKVYTGSNSSSQDEE